MFVPSSCLERGDFLHLVWTVSVKLYPLWQHEPTWHIMPAQNRQHGHIVADNVVAAVDKSKDPARTAYYLRPNIMVSLTLFLMV